MLSYLRKVLLAVAIAFSGYTISSEPADLLDANASIYTAEWEREIVSADRGFDDLPGLKRLDPSDLATWRAGL